ncbi:hypothetical protein Mapa_007276 [Marchantia paleacea]|nr:hypothetical protein Mapa_007276 [Marchantia paleacea]
MVRLRLGGLHILLLLALLDIHGVICSVVNCDTSAASPFGPDAQDAVDYLYKIPYQDCCQLRCDPREKMPAH